MFKTAKMNSDDLTYEQGECWVYAKYFQKQEGKAVKTIVDSHFYDVNQEKRYQIYIIFTKNTIKVTSLDNNEEDTEEYDITTLYDEIQREINRRKFRKLFPNLKDELMQLVYHPANFSEKMKLIQEGKLLW